MRDFATGCVLIAYLPVHYAVLLVLMIPCGPLAFLLMMVGKEDAGEDLLEWPGGVVDGMEARLHRALGLRAESE